MSTTDNPAGGGWDKIQTGIKDTERLIGQKKYKDRKSTRLNSSHMA